MQVFDRSNPGGYIGLCLRALRALSGKLAHLMATLTQSRQVPEGNRTRGGGGSRIVRSFETIQRLSESNEPSAVFYGHLLMGLVEALSGSAGIVWGRKFNGELRKLFHINLASIGLDKSDDATMQHWKLLRNILRNPRSIHLPAHADLGVSELWEEAAGNPSHFDLLSVPIMADSKPIGIIEVWQAPGRPLEAVRGLLKFMAIMAEYAANYQRRQGIDYWLARA